MAARLVYSKQCFKLPVSRVLYCSIPCTQTRNAARRIHMGEHFSRGLLKEMQLQTPVPLAGRKYLPSSDSPGFPKHLSGPKENFPMLIKAKNGQNATMKQWAMRSREIIDQAYQQYEDDGSAVAIVFRGLPNVSEKDFAEWVNNLGFKPFPYVGGTAARHEVEPNVSGGATDHESFTIEPHNDMTYSVKYPKIFTISCLKKPLWGGETAICDNRDLDAKLDRGFVQKFVDKKIRYLRCLPSKDSPKYIYQSWQLSFLTEDRAKVGEHLKADGYEFAWDNDSVFFWHDLPPYRNHAISGEPIWFNQITPHHCDYWKRAPMFRHVKLADIEYPTHTTFGDGEEIKKYELDYHRRCNWESAVGFQWQNGDVLFVDQLLVQHSRLGFKGERKVCISILNY